MAHMYDEEGLGPVEIAQRLRRSLASVRARLTKLRKRGHVGPARGRGGRRSQVKLPEIEQEQELAPVTEAEGRRV